MSIRTRSRNTVVEEPSAVTRTGRTMAPFTGVSSCGGVYYWSTTDGTTIPSEFNGYHSKEGIEESITDQSDGRLAWNACRHTKTDWQFPLRYIAYDGESYAYAGKHCTEETRGTCSAGDSVVQKLSHNDPLWDSNSNALIRATNAIKFGVQDNSVNIPTFLGELRDFATLFKLVFGKLGRSDQRARTSQDLQRIKAIAKRALRGDTTVKEVFVALSAVDLSYQWAIKPLLNDLKKLTKAGEHLASQYSRLMRAEPFSVHGSVTDKGISNDVNNAVYHTSLISYFRTRHVTATCEIQYHIENFPTMPAILADSLGLDDIHLAAWELTRWSFMVDYFVQVGDWLNQFGGDLCEVPYTILRECYSIKLTTEADVSTTFDDVETIREEHWSRSDTNRTVKGKVIRTYYNRVTDEALPHGAFTLVPTIKLPNLRQVVNLTELGILMSESR